MYMIGDLMTEEVKERGFDSLEDAETAAVERSIDDGAWAVWSDEGSERNPCLLLVSIVYQQNIYS